MPGFNVSDLIENSGLQAADSVHFPSSFKNTGESVKESVQSENMNYSAHFYSRKSNRYGGLIGLMRDVFRRQAQYHQQLMQSPDPKGLSPSCSNILDERMVSEHPVSSSFNEPPLISSFLSEIGSDPNAWQRLFYLHPELVDYMVSANSPGNHAVSCSSDPKSSVLTDGVKLPLSGKNNTSGLTGDRRVDMPKCIIDPYFLNTFGLPGYRPVAISTRAAGNTTDTTTPTNALTNYTSWLESAGLNDTLGNATHRASLYVDPRSVTSMDCCSIGLAGGTNSTMMFPPELRKPKRIRTAFSPAQLFQLENTFERNHYVVGQERKDLAAGLGLTETQVKVWFQNRRTKYKRMRLDDPDQSNSTCGAGPDSPNISGSGNHSDEGLDLSNERVNSYTSVGGPERRTNDHSVALHEEPNDPIDNTFEEAVRRKSHHEMDRLFQPHQTTQSDTNGKTEQRPDCGFVTNDFSHQTAYTSNHLTYATRAIHSHLFGISS
ncbi:hypothetical protein D915_005093 [Fasciola hepatica]|uniref:Homeobox domain-containing protein n=1 Tax=Fasciola hepatica TaxID=6192 RepID=A0A4E0RD47_FASHE|nr:hypothetical protein D915_005093 [Fasciola hepatica]